MATVLLRSLALVLLHCDGSLSLCCYAVAAACHCVAMLWQQLITLCCYAVTVLSLVLLRCDGSLPLCCYAAKVACHCVAMLWQ